MFGLQPEPSPELQAKLDAGKVILGGCCYPDPGVDPNWECVDCGAGYIQEFELSGPFGDSNTDTPKAGGPSN